MLLCVKSLSMAKDIEAIRGLKIRNTFAYLMAIIKLKTLLKYVFIRHK